MYSEMTLADIEDINEDYPCRLIVMLYDEAIAGLRATIAAIEALKVGSGNNAHLNEFFCVPQARFLGVSPQDIVDYELPTHPLKDVDIKRAKDALKNDPFFQHHQQWSKALNQLLKMGVRAEQQAFAKFDLNYVIDTFSSADDRH